MTTASNIVLPCFCDKAQREQTQAMLDELRERAVFAQPMVTECVAAGQFYRAEDCHRDYYSRHPLEPYCAFVVALKLDKFRKTFARLRKLPG